MMGDGHRRDRAVLIGSRQRDVLTFADDFEPKSLQRS
jgi:hypothetical protein